MKNQKTYIYIDNENVNVSVIKQWWKMDREKLYKWLSKEYNTETIKMFMWWHPNFQKMYDFFETIWYTLIFRKMNTGTNVPLKWNIDTELVLEAMKDFTEYKKAVILSWDWDFACLVEYLRENKKLESVIVPNKKRYSDFLNDAAGKKKIRTLTWMKKELRYNPNEVHDVEYDTDASTEEWPFWM